MLEQGDARAYFDGVVEVVRRDQHRGPCLAVVGSQQVLDDGLAGGVEEVERLVEDEQLGTVEHGADDAYLLLVAHGVVTDELLFAEDFAVEEGAEVLEAFADGLFLHAIHAAEEGEVFVGREVVDEEALVDEGTGVALPVLGGGDGGVGERAVLGADGDVAFVGFQKVEDEAEQRGLAGTVITDEAHHVAVADDVTVDVGGDDAAELLMQIVDGDNHGVCIYSLTIDK